jgi:hypothetical protein
MTNYRLINPFIQGDFKNLFTGKTQYDAALAVWEKISKFFANNLPKFPFTIEKINDHSLYHFIVKESLSGGDNKVVNYKISELDLKLSDNQVKDLKDKVTKLQQSKKGGQKEDPKKKKDEDDDSSSSDSCSSDVFKQLYWKQYYFNRPVMYWWYNPCLYRLPQVYIPTFVAPLAPYIELQTIYIQ